MTIAEVLMPERRISSLISQSAYEAFMRLAEEDRITMSDRIAALVELWESDAEVRAKADARARTLAIEKRRRRYDRSKT